MTFSIAVRTVPQRKELFDKLHKDLLRIEQHPSIKGIHISSSLAVTPNENGCLALEAALTDKTDWVIFLEDDAGLITDFIGSVERWINDHMIPDIHIYPLGCQYAESWPSLEATMWVYPIKKFYCSVALVIRASKVLSLIQHLRDNAHVKQGFDLMSGHWHKTISISEDLVTPIPCFVDHLGDDSTLIDGREGRDIVGHFRGFRGYDYSYRGLDG